MVISSVEGGSLTNLLVMEKYLCPPFFFATPRPTSKPFNCWFEDWCVPTLSREVVLQISVAKYICNHEHK